MASEDLKYNTHTILTLRIRTGDIFMQVLCRYPSY